MARWAVIFTCGLTVSGCGMLQRLSDVGRPPEMTKSADPTKDPGYRPMTMPMPKTEVAPNEANALWRQGSRAFFKDQRAAQVGDIVTVVVSMTDSANLNNVTTLTRSSGEQAGVPDFVGLTSKLPKSVIDPSKLISLSSSNSNTGNGQIQRKSSS
jgi:flagellar L-ring protein FlgH